MSFVSPLYSSRFEHDACGIGAVVDIRGRKSHGTVDSALKIVEKLEHRAGKDAAGETGDGVGLLLQVPHRLMVKATGNLGIALGGERDYGVGVFFFPQDRVRRAQAHWSSWAGGTCRSIRRCWGRRREAVCPISATAS